MLLIAFVVLLFLNGPLMATLPWASTIDLSEAGINSFFSSFALSTDGRRAIAIWENDTDGTVEVKYSSNGGADWSGPITLSTSGDNAQAPQLALSADGLTGVAIWGIYDENTQQFNEIQASTTTDGGANWTSPVIIPSSPAYFAADNPQVALSSDGQTAIAVWESPFPSYIMASSSLDGGMSWSISPTNLGFSEGSSIVSLAMSSDGQKAVCVWDTNNNIFSNFTQDGGMTWGTAQQLSTSGQFPQIALSSDGLNGISVWTDSSNDPNGVIVSRSTSNGGMSWMSQVTLSNSAGDSDLSHIALSSDGLRGIAGWLDFTNNVVQAVSTSNGGTSWEAPIDISGFRIISGLRFSLPFPSIGLSEDGLNGVFLWANFLDTMTMIETSNTTDGGQTWSLHPQTLSQFISTPGNIQVQVSGSGNSGVAVWDGYDGTNGRIQENYFALFLLPPSFLSVEFYKCNDFGAFREYYNVLNWGASSSSQVAGYKIFRNGILIQSVGPNVLSFADHDQKKGARVKYGVAAVDAKGNESPLKTRSGP